MSSGQSPNKAKDVQRPKPHCCAGSVVPKLISISSDGTRASDEPRLECQICCEPMTVVAVGRCVDRMCWVCSLRLRKLHKNFACPFCLAESTNVVFTSKVDSGLADFDISSWQPPRRDSSAGIYFETEEIAKATNNLMAIKCWICPNGGRETTFQTHEILQQHLISNHRRKLCWICLSGRSGSFLVEQFLYDPGDLARHCLAGDQNTRPPIAAHPRCRWCKRNFYDEKSYNQHLNVDHFACDVCHIDAAASTPHVLVSNGSSLFPVFATLEGLISHYSVCHFPCPYKECHMEVFGTAIELQYHLARKHGGLQRSSGLKLSLQELARLAAISSPAELSTAPLAARPERRRERRPVPNLPAGPATMSQSPVESPRAVDHSNPLSVATVEICGKLMSRLSPLPPPPEDGEPRFVRGFRAFLNSQNIKTFCDIREKLVRRPPKRFEVAAAMIVDSVWLLWDKSNSDQNSISLSWKQEKDLSVPAEILFLNILTAQEAGPLLVEVLSNWRSIAAEQTRDLIELGSVLRSGLLPALADAVVRVSRGRQILDPLTSQEKKSIDDVVQCAYLDKGVDPSTSLLFKSHLVNLITQPHLEGLDSLRPVQRRLTCQSDSVELSHTWQLDYCRVFSSWDTKELSTLQYYLSRCQRASSSVDRNPQADPTEFPELSDSKAPAPRMHPEWRRAPLPDVDEFPSLSTPTTQPTPARWHSRVSRPNVPSSAPPVSPDPHDDFPPLTSAAAARQEETRWGPSRETKRRCGQCHFQNTPGTFRCSLCGNKFY